MRGVTTRCGSPTVRDVRDVPRSVPPGTAPLAAAGVLDVVFVLGVLQADEGPGGSPWRDLSAYLLALTLPLLLIDTVALTGPTAGRPSRWQAATLALAGLGFAAYLSPWGRAGISVVLES